MALSRRIAPALDAVHEGLKLAHRELAGSREDPPRRRWVAVGLVSALQAGLVAALSGYECAEEGDIADPSQPERIAPVTLLLRRARSAEYLSPPEQLEMTGSEARRIERVIAARNSALHGLGAEELPEEMSWNDAYRSVLRVLQQVCLTHPAFPEAGHGVVRALIRDEIAAVYDLLAESG